MRDKNKLLYKREYERNKIESETMGQDLEFLTKIGDKFDPLETAIKNGSSKRKRMD
jgi:hypothetical protein